MAENDETDGEGDAQLLEPYSEDSDSDRKNKEEKCPNFCLRILNLPKKLKINLLREAIKENALQLINDYILKII